MARKSRKKLQLGIVEKQEKTTYQTAIYARLSVEEKEGETSSIDNQILIAKTFIENHKELTYIDKYVDNGHTGTNFDRPGFLRLLQDTRDGKVNCVIVKDLSRFGRNYLEMGNYLENIFPKMGVRFISINDDFDSNLEENNDGLVVSLKSLLHDYYAKDISKKVSTAIDVKKKNGKFMNRIPPYGYVISADDKYKLEIQKEQAEVIKNIFFWRLEGLGATSISRRLNDMGIPSQLKLRFLQGCSDGKETALWHGSTVLNILKNPCYLGCLVERKTQKALYKGGFEKVIPQEKWNLIQNTHEPIVSQETFLRVQELLKESALHNNCKEKKYYNKELRENIFRGMIICGECGTVLQRGAGYYLKDGTTIHYYYNCPRKYLKKGACKATSVSEEKLREVVFEACKRQIDLFNNMEVKLGGKDQFRSMETMNQLLRCNSPEKLTSQICHLLIQKIVINKNCFTIHFAYKSEYEKGIS